MDKVPHDFAEMNIQTKMFRKVTIFILDVIYILLIPDPKIFIKLRLVYSNVKQGYPDYFLNILGVTGEVL